MLERSRVLLVERSAHAAVPLLIGLEASGAEVDYVRSVAAARRLLSGHTPDLLISELRLADGSGADLIGQARAVVADSGRRLVTVALCDGGPEADAEALAAGFDAAMSRAELPGAALERLERLLGEVRALGEELGDSTARSRREAERHRELLGELQARTRRVVDAAEQLRGAEPRTATSTAREPRSAATLAVEEAKYRALFEAIDEGFCLLERVEGDGPIDFRYVEANPAFAAETGAGDVVGRTIRDVFPGAPEEGYAIYERVWRTGEPVRSELNISALGISIDLYAFRIDAHPPRVAVLFRNITERARAEAEVREGRARLAALFESLPVGVGVIDTDGRFILSNLALERYVPTGIIPSRDATRGSRWRARHPDGRAVERQDYPAARALRGERVVPGNDFLYTADDGGEYWTRVTAAPVRDAAGAVVGGVVVIADVDAFKRTEEALRESEARFRSALQIETVGVIFWDEELRISDANNAFLRMTGFDRDEAIGKSWRELTPEEFHPSAEQFIAEYEASGRPTPYEKQYYRKDGSRWWGLFAAQRLGEHETVEFVLDVSELKRLREELGRANEALEERVLARTRELEQVSAVRQELLERLVSAQEEERSRIARDLHDSLGQYVTALGLAVRAVEDRVDDPESLERLASLRTITGEVDRELDRMVFHLRPTVLDDHGLGHAVPEYVTAWSDWTNVSADVLVTGLDGDRPPAHLEATVYRIVQEALTNIAKHAGASRVSVLLERLGGRLVATIEDDGRGFDVTSTLGASSEKGGWGLLGMRERAAAAGGAFHVESRPGVGTTIVVRLPLADVSMKGDT